MATPFEQVGGEAAVTALINLFYDKLLADAKMRHRFEGGDLVRVKAGQYKFWAKHLGAPGAEYTTDLRTVHHNMHITQEEYDYTVQILLQAARELNVPEDLVAALKGITDTNGGFIVGQ